MRQNKGVYKMPPNGIGAFCDAQGIELRLDDKVAFTSSAVTKLTLGRVLRLHRSCCDVTAIGEGGHEFTQSVNSYEIVLIPDVDYE